MTDILSIEAEPLFDERIVKMETHAYNPYANTTLGLSDEIRIPIQHQDSYALPCESFLYVEGILADEAQKSETHLDNNCVAFMFDEIRYELDGVEIDRNRNVGITSTLKNFASLSADTSLRLRNAGWDIGVTANPNPLFDHSSFNFCVPLNMLLGFCEDYKRVVINARHELVLIRARNDINCMVSVENGYKNPTITLLKVQWRMPHVTLSDVEKLTFLRTLESGKYLSMGFHSWDLYEYPLLPTTNKHSWAVKTATHLEKPRYVIFALQSNRKNNILKNASMFDHNRLTNVKLYLNSDFYPYDNLNLDFEKNRWALLYDMCARFRKAYYRRKEDDVFLARDKFLTWGPFVVIDCSRQNESIKSGTVDVRIEFECKDNVELNTTAYCLIIHDRVVDYNPLTNIVRKIV